MGAWFASVKNWLDAPFKQPLDAIHLFLVTGLVIVFIILWSRILAALPKEIGVEA